MTSPTLTIHHHFLLNLRRIRLRKGLIKTLGGETQLRLLRTEEIRALNFKLRILLLLFHDVYFHF